MRKTQKRKLRKRFTRKRGGASLSEPIKLSSLKNIQQIAHALATNGIEYPPPDTHLLQQLQRPEFWKGSKQTLVDSAMKVPEQYEIPPAQGNIPELFDYRPFAEAVCEELTLHETVLLNIQRSNAYLRIRDANDKKHPVFISELDDALKRKCNPDKSSKQSTTSKKSATAEERLEDLPNKKSIEKGTEVYKAGVKIGTIDSEYKSVRPFLDVSILPVNSKKTKMIKLEHGLIFIFNGRKFKIE
jgi:hypothetical protein